MLGQRCPCQAGREDELDIESIHDASPINIFNGVSVKTVASGTHHTCLVDIMGRCKCFGDGLMSKLGTSSYDRVTAHYAKFLPLNDGVQAVCAGEDHTCLSMSTANGPKTICFGYGTFHLALHVTLSHIEQYSDIFDTGVGAVIKQEL